MNCKSVFKNYCSSSKLRSIALFSLILLTLVFKSISTIHGWQLENQNVESINIYNSGEFLGINPLFTNGDRNNQILSNLLFRGLVKYDPEKNIYNPDLADFTISKDATEFSFTLKQEQYWSDSRPITIEDVLYTYKTVIQNSNFQNEFLKAQFSQLVIEQSRDNQITVKLPSSNSFFISQFTHGILPKHIYKNINIEDISKQIDSNIVSSGNYEIEKIKEKKDLVQINLASKQTQPNIIYDIGSYDPENSYNLILDANVQNPVGFTQHNYLTPQYTALFMNLENSYLNNFIHRKAIKDAVNKRELALKLPGETIIGKPFFQFEQIDEIPETSFKIIKENLKSSKSHNSLKPGDTIKLSVIALKYESEEQNQKIRTVLNHLNENLSKINIELVAQLYNIEVFKQILVTKEYDMAIFGHDLGGNLDSYSFWHSSQRFQNGLNISMYSNILTDNLLDNLRREQDQNKKISLAKEINKQLSTDNPAIFLFTTKHLYYVDNKIKNRKILKNYSNQSDILFDINTWELEK